MILLTVDMSPASEVALPTAVELARRFDQTVRILLVVDGPLRHHIDSQARELGIDAATVVDRYLAQLEARATIDGASAEVRYRHAVDAGPVIVEEAEESDVFLVVMATHGRSGLSRLLAGSVTEYVIRQSSVPTVVVPAGEAEP